MTIVGTVIGRTVKYRALAHIDLADDVERVRHERVQTEQRLRRLGTAYVDGLYDDDGYRREKRSLEDKLANLVVPGVDAAMKAGNLLMVMLDAVYVDTVEEKSVVAIWPKPAFRPIFEVVTTRYVLGGDGGGSNSP